MPSTALITAESRCWFMPGCRLEVGLMQCGFNTWPTVSVCRRLWEQMQTPRGTFKTRSITPQSKVCRHEPTSPQQCECWAVKLHTDNAGSPDHFYVPVEKQKVILRSFILFRPSLRLRLLQSDSSFKERSSPPARSQSENIQIKSFNW